MDYTNPQNFDEEKETLEACCKLMANILHKRGKAFNATEITFKVEGISNKENDLELIGDIEVKWSLERN